MRFEVEINPGDEDGTVSGYAKVTIAKGDRRLDFRNATAADVRTGMDKLADALDEDLTDGERNWLESVLGGDDD